ncbi:MAG: hypothetical protein ACHQAX_08285 [Gammaproteobacteria bacterium]
MMDLTVKSLNKTPSGENFFIYLYGIYGFGTPDTERELKIATSRLFPDTWTIRFEASTHRESPKLIIDNFKPEEFLTSKYVHARIEAVYLQIMNLMEKSFHNESDRMLISYDSIKEGQDYMTCAMRTHGFKEGTYGFKTVQMGMQEFEYSFWVLRNSFYEHRQKDAEIKPEIKSNDRSSSNTTATKSLWLTASGSANSLGQKIKADLKTDLQTLAGHVEAGDKDNIANAVSQILENHTDISDGLMSTLVSLGDGNRETNMKELGDRITELKSPSTTGCKS